ncbi:tRNA (adenosine(37)-N6)-dimethylallyltransferase MiaA [Paracoccaceae bacterium]|nr:tRNA (adenosine(37)-N6)-dimethylallyltransferase MiaA [Paracoccaceae bacterium]
MPKTKYLEEINPNTPILIAGQTASGKSHLAFQIAAKHGGTIINADAIQVYNNWRILTARPSIADEAKINHKLYGHKDGVTEYSVGIWIKEIRETLLCNSRPIIVGGTGLYFSALISGLVDIPEIPEVIRQEATSKIAENGFESLLGEIDEKTAEKIDKNNPMRVQRAWEVLRSTGRGLNSWHNETTKPTLDINKCKAILVDGEVSLINDRINKRFDQMIEQGLIHEAEKNLATWNKMNPSSKAIGAQELIDYLNNKISIDELREQILVATRQYAKRQRTWFRSKMRSWEKYIIN